MKKKMKIPMKIMKIMMKKTIKKKRIHKNIFLLFRFKYYYIYNRRKKLCVWKNIFKKLYMNKHKFLFFLFLK